MMQLHLIDVKGKEANHTCTSTSFDR